MAEWQAGAIDQFARIARANPVGSSAPREHAQLYVAATADFDDRPGVTAWLGRARGIFDWVACSRAG
jgi:hypothetical protein